MTLTGVGLFSSLPSRVTIHPCGEHPRGLVLRRTDLADLPAVPARVGHVITRPRQTVLCADPTCPGATGAISTVEHLLSALTAAGITDAMVEVGGAEVPLMDGSSLPFLEAIEQAGRAAVPMRGGEAGPLVVRERIELRDASGQAWIRAEPLHEGDPADALVCEYWLDYGAGSPIAPHRASFALLPGGASAEAYRSQIAPCRTFCTDAEARAMRAAGMFSHLEPKDVLVIGPDGPVDTAERLPGEPARHKVLDMIGDLTLAGGGMRWIVGRVTACRTGHAQNHALATAIVQRFS